MTGSEACNRGRPAGSAVALQDPAFPAERAPCGLVRMLRCENDPAAETLEPLIEPGPSVLDAYRPRQGYLLLDEQRIANTGALPERNLSAALFRLEASRGSAAVMGIVRALADWLQAPEQLGLRRAFTIWLGRVFLPRRLPGVEVPPLNDLSEVYQMLTENLESWTDQLLILDDGDAWLRAVRAS